MSGPEDNPLVSVCLMTYNRASLLPGVIDAWLAQTYPNFELVISDDASVDETPKICEAYVKKDKRVKYFRNEKNQNAPGCYKVALSRARGDYFIWASDDDLWDKRFLEDCMGVFKKNPELVMVFADMVDIDKDGKVFKHLDPKLYMPLSKDLYNRLKEHMLFHFGDGKLQLIFGLWKRSAVLADPLFGPSARADRYPYYWGFDNYLVFRGLTKGGAGFFPETRFFRRSRVLDEYRPPRPLLPRLFTTLTHRFRKVFGSPYFCYIAHRIITTKELSFFEKVKLVFWNFLVILRLFFQKKV